MSENKCSGNCACNGTCDENCKCGGNCSCKETYGFNSEDVHQIISKNPGSTPLTHLGIITRFCYGCFICSANEEELLRNISIIKTLLLDASDTPELDEAYIDGMKNVFTFLRGGTP